MVTHPPFFTQEVKSTDDGVDASYVVKLRPKPKKVEIDLNSEVERLQKENKELEKQMKEMGEKYNKLETENKDLQTKKPKFGKSTDISKLHQKVREQMLKVREQTIKGEGIVIKR